MGYMSQGVWFVFSCGGKYVVGCRFMRLQAMEVSIMEELQSQELDDLVQEPDVESGAEEALPAEVEGLLRILEAGSLYLYSSRRIAAKQLGGVSRSSRRIVQALMAAAEADSSDEVRAMAAESLRAPVHQEYLQEHPDVVEPLDSTLDQASGKGETGRGMPAQESKIPIQCLKAGAVAGLVVGLAIGFWYAQQPGDHPGCGVPFLVALTLGAVVGAPVGAVVGAEERGRKDRIPSIAAGAISAALVASLSWLPIAVFRIVQLGGP
jgi:hypothetical protein